MAQVASALVGTKFRGKHALRAIDNMVEGDPVRLEREDHPNDVNAIKCFYLGTDVGYIPRAVNPPIAALMDMGVQVTARVAKPPKWDKTGKHKSEPLLILEWSEP
jgi:hypothetical protein